MKSAESAKSYEPTYNDATCQEMYESSMWELAEEGRQLQKEVKAWPKTNEDAKNLIKKWEVSLIINNIDNYRCKDNYERFAANAANRTATYSGSAAAKREKWEEQAYDLGFYRRIYDGKL